MAQIKKDTSLRKAILQAAITGKLKIDNGELKNEETGKELLDRIIEERMSKEKMSRGLDFANAKSGKKKTKKETALAGSNPCDNIPEEEIPFEIPENWCWCRWGELSESIQYGYNAPAKESGRIKMVRITDIQNGKVQWDTVPFCEISEEEIKTYRLRKNDILFARTGGTVGKSFLVDEEPENAVYAGYLIRTQYNSEKLNPKYMKMFMESQLYWDQLKNGTIATAQPNCNGQTLSKMILPLPPLAVQNAIVEKLEQVLPLVDAYENALLQKEELKNALPDKVKKAILQEAITGKLTEAWRKSATIKESGKQLLDRIIEERNAKALAEWEEALKKNPKAKKPVSVVASEIEEAEIPFEVPESWCWCRLGDVGDWGAGATPNRSKKEYYSSEGIPWIKTGELNNGIVTASEEFITEKALKECSIRYNKVGDVMIAMYGATIGKVAIAGIELTTNQACCACTPFSGLYNIYLFYFLMANKENFINQGEGGAQPNISREKIVKTLIPLPPLEEQEEIVKKLEELLPLCKKIGE